MAQGRLGKDEFSSGWAVTRPHSLPDNHKEDLGRSKFYSHEDGQVACGAEVTQEKQNKEKGLDHAPL